MTRFIFNNEMVSTPLPHGTTLLDFIRYEKNKTGTKIGCREGDCGACTVLVGNLVKGQMNYQSVTSCITPLGNINGKHVVTIEGLNMPVLTPVQQAMVDESGTQCGFCTVGFVMSLTGACFKEQVNTYEDVLSAIDGNICRCTGYKSIERAAHRVFDLLEKRKATDTISWLVEQRFIPPYFATIAKRVSEIEKPELPIGSTLIGGGTDLYVHKHHETEAADLHFMISEPSMSGVCIENDTCIIGASTTTTQLLESPLLSRVLPDLKNHLKLVSSTPIRNIATVAGNIKNASPIGDLSILFIALNSEITLRNNQNKTRRLPLKDFFLAYKKTVLQEDEHIFNVAFKIPDERILFNFEKVSKRKFLDIASVNTAIRIRVENGKIEEVFISAGGVGPVPMSLDRAAAFLNGKELSIENVILAQQIIAEEIAPMSDVRGSKEYKTLLLQKLFFAHFVVLFPNVFDREFKA